MTDEGNICFATSPAKAEATTECPHIDAKVSSQDNPHNRYLYTMTFDEFALDETILEAIGYMTD